MYQLYFGTTNLLMYPLFFNKNMGFPLAIIQRFPSIWATGLLISRPIVDIWQNFEYGLLMVKRKKKYLYTVSEM